MTLHKGQEVSVDIRFKGGAIRSLKLPRSQSAGELRKTPPEVVQEIDRLLERHGHEEIAALLNQSGFRSGEGQLFNKQMISHIGQTYHLKERRQREKERGLLTRKAISELLGISEWRVTDLFGQGYLESALLRGVAGKCMNHPTEQEIEKIRSIPPSKIGLSTKSTLLTSK